MAGRRRPRAHGRPGRTCPRAIATLLPHAWPDRSVEGSSSTRRRDRPGVAMCPDGARPDRRDAARGEHARQSLQGVAELYDVAAADRGRRVDRGRRAAPRGPRRAPARAVSSGRAPAPRNTETRLESDVSTVIANPWTYAPGQAITGEATAAVVRPQVREDQRQPHRRRQSRGRRRPPQVTARSVSPPMTPTSASSCA